MKSQSVLITGGGTGIGASCARMFANEGFKVFISGRRKEPLETMAAELGSSVVAVQCDITNADQIKNLAETVISDAENLTTLVNNAGIFLPGLQEKADQTHWQRIFATNFFGAVQLTQFIYQHFKKQGQGSIVNISSTLGERPTIGTGAYSASKAAMNTWGECLALEGARYGIRVNTVCPGVVDTPIHDFSETGTEPMDQLHPLGRIGRPEEVAQAVYYFCGPNSQWTTGATLNIDGGISLTLKE